METADHRSAGTATFCDDEMVVAIVARLRERLPGLMAVYLFGSVASGEASADSDLDIAVLVEGRADPLQLWELSGELADIAGRHVDLVDLRDASTVMQYQVITRGRRLWFSDVRVGLWEAFVISEKTALDEARAPLMADIRRDGRIHGR